MNILLIDNYDSFTYTLRDYIGQTGAHCVVVRNDEAGNGNLSPAGYDALVISPGPKTPDQNGMLMDMIEQYHTTKPILGICLGHQGIGMFFGAQLVKAGLPKHGKVELVHHHGDPIFHGMQTPFPATRYHSLLLTDVQSPLQEIAWSASNEVMALRHKELPVYGIQFHPESCMTPQGHRIIENFMSIVKQLA